MNSPQTRAERVRDLLSVILALTDDQSVHRAVGEISEHVRRMDEAQKSGGRYPGGRS